MRQEWKPVTVRLTETAYNALTEIASEHGLSLAEVVRLAVDMDLEKYRRDFKCADYDQGKAIQGQLLTLANTMQDVLFQLRRLGVNYNQELKLRQKELLDIQAEKAAAAKLTGMAKIDTMMRLEKEEKAVAEKLQGLDTDAVKNLIDQFREVTREVGEGICRTLG